MHGSAFSGAPAGAANLIANCLRARPGQSLLIVGEEGPLAHFDRASCHIVAETAARMGLDASVVIAPETHRAGDVPDDLRVRMAESDHTVFFARMADQLRFLGVEGGGSMFAAYAITPDVLADRFAQVDHRLFQAVHDNLVARIERSNTFRITCPDGSELEGEVAFPDGGDAIVDFMVQPFPVMIFPPVDCSRMSGRLALLHRMTSSSTNIYDGSVFTPRVKVMATVEDGVITTFDGEPGEVERLRRHFENVGAMAGGNPFAVNSWHTGINPLSAFDGDPDADVERWSTAIFGSPRMTHFHTCGDAPGDIAVSLFDATVSFDGIALWRDGCFVFLDEPENQALLERFPGSADAFDMRWDIGVPRRIQLDTA